MSQTFVRMLLFAILGIAIPLRLCQAQQIYKWTGQEGRIHFSTEPQTKGQQPVALPLIQRQDLDGKIREIKARTPTNCQEHGQVDCSKGPDTDGSVICLDGFAGAALPFRFSCMEVKLSVDRSTLLSAQGRELPWQTADQGFPKGAVISVPIRNLSPIEAYGVAVSIQSQPPIALHGPSKIEPYGLADYNLPIENLPTDSITDKGVLIKAVCTNCRGSSSERVAPSREKRLER